VNAAMGDYKLFRRDRQGRRGGGLALYVGECFDCLELDTVMKRSSVYG